MGRGEGDVPVGVGDEDTMASAVLDVHGDADTSDAGHGPIALVVGVELEEDIGAADDEA